MNGYMRWLSDNRDSIKTELSASGECSLAKSVLKAAGGKWRELSEEEKTPYVSAYTSAKAEYTKAMLLYKPSSLPVEESVSSIITETLDGYEGPYKHKYLSRYASKDKYDSLSLAAEGALLLGDKCGGITLEVKGKYSLRKGCSLKDSGMKMEYSWMKSETSSADEAEATNDEATNDEVTNDEVTNDEVTNDEVTNDEVTNDEVTNDNEEKPKKHTLTRSKDKLAKAKADAKAKAKLAKAEAEAEAEAEAKAKAKAEAETDDETDGPVLSDEDSDVEVEEWPYKGVKYLVDEENIVYDFDTREPVGKREGGELTLNKYM